MKILCCGDSHTGIFKYCDSKQNDFQFDVCIVSGATAQGAVNPNSKTNALKIFKEKINTTKANKLLIMLGEVDCGFVVWVRSKRYNISVDEQIKISVENLFSFVYDIVKGENNYTHEDIIIAGAVLPTIKDSTDKRYLCGARSEVDISQIERTRKTIEYNNILRNRCEQYGYRYIEITNHIMGSEGIVKNEFLHSNTSNHHLDDDKTYNLWIDQLKMLNF